MSQDLKSTVLQRTFPVAPCSVHEVEEGKIWDDRCEKGKQVKECVSMPRKRRERVLNDGWMLVAFDTHGPAQREW